MNLQEQIKTRIESQIIQSLYESEDLHEILKSKFAKRVGMGLAGLALAGGIYGGVKSMSTPKLTQTSGVVIDDMYVDAERGPEVAGKPGVAWKSRKEDEKAKLRQLGQEALKRGTTTTQTQGGVTTTTTSGSLSIRNGQVQPSQGSSAPKASPVSATTPKGTHVGRGIEGEAP